MEKKMSLKFEVFKAGALIGEEVLSQETIKIGKDLGNHLLIDDSDLSGTHAVVEVGRDNQVFINDLGGLTGTKVNGQPVGRSEIKSKDVITFGSIDVRVSFVSSGARGQGNGNGVGSTAPTGAKQTKLGMPAASSSAPPPKRSSSAPPPKRSSSNPPPPPPQNGRRSSSTPPPPIPTPKVRPVMPDLPDGEVVVLNQILSAGSLVDFLAEGRRLRIEETRFKAEVDALKGELQDKEEEVKSLRGDIDVLSSQLTASGQELVDKKDKVSRLESLLESQRVRVEQLQKANTGLVGQCERKGANITVLSSQLQEAETLLSRVQASYDKLVRELQIKESETQHYVVENEELRLQASNLIEEFGLIQGFLDNANAQNVEVEKLVALNQMMGNLSGKVDRLDAYLGGEVDSLSDSTPDLSCDDGTPAEWKQVDSASTRISQSAESSEATYSGEDTALLLEGLEDEEFPEEVPISATPTYPSKRVSARNLFVALVVLCLGALAGSVYLAVKGEEQVPEDQQKTEMVESSSPSEVEVPAVKSDSFKDEDTEALMKQVVEIGRIKNGQKAPQPQSSPFNSVKDCDDLSSDKRVQCIVYMARKARGEN